MYYWDTNGDGTLNLADNITDEDLENINAACDFNNNGETDICEIHECLINYENTWRAENCPGYGEAFCTCPFTIVYECPGSWDCEMIE